MGFWENYFLLIYALRKLHLKWERAIFYPIDFQMKTSKKCYILSNLSMYLFYFIILNLEHLVCQC